MDDNREFVVWNGSLGVLDTVFLGRVEQDSSGRAAWLAAPYDMVGPFNLDELETMGQVAFGACLVLSRRKWQEDQIELRIAAREQRRAQAKRFTESDDDGDARDLLDLPSDGALKVAEINAAFRRRAKTAHPDAGGDHETYCQLTEARDTLLRTAAPN